jgi:hypothetical protein
MNGRRIPDAPIHNHQVKYNKKCSFISRQLKYQYLAVAVRLHEIAIRTFLFDRSYSY